MNADIEAERLEGRELCRCVFQQSSLLIHFATSFV
jgi:hypothetical protein